MLSNILHYDLALATAIVYLYQLVSTVSAISQLKSQGFLQLMIRRGLSPFSYWAAVWITSSIELLLLTASLAMSFLLYCPKMYTFSQILISLIIIGSYLFCQAAVLLLFTVLSNNYYTICTLVFLYVAISMCLTLADQLKYQSRHHNFDLKIIHQVLKLMPCFGVVSQLHESLESRINPDLNYNSGIVGSAVNVGKFVVLVAVTLYLDHVLKTGNALCYPACFLWARAPSDEALPEIGGEGRPSVESLDLPVFVRVSGASYDLVRNEPDMSVSHNLTAGGGVTVDFYDNQLTAVVGEDSVNTGTFLNALTGRERVKGGLVWINGCPASNPLSRPFEHTKLGECPQDDALCYGLTVLHTLRMALVSSGNDWADSQGEVNKVAALFRLVSKLPCSVGKLSCGERRQLSVVQALLGTPRLIILNDPTRGLDPLSRQRLWRLLHDYRSDRCIIVSTQFIDEAGTYADRAVLLSPTTDSVVCAGSPGFLSRAVICDVVAQAALSENAQSKQAAESVLDRLPKGVAASLQNSLLSVRLTASDPSALPDTLKVLKSIGQSVSSVGINLPMLSDVYARLKRLSVDQINHMFLNKSNQEVSPDATEENTDLALDIKHIDNENSQHLKTESLFLFSMCAMFRLHCCLLRRNPGTLVVRLRFSVVILMLHTLMLLFDKNSASLHSAVWTNVSSGQAANLLSRGFCISDWDIPEIHQTNEIQCSMIFSGQSAIGGSFRILRKSRKERLYDFLRGSNQIQALEDHCLTLLPTQLPCAIIYANSWYHFLHNNGRQMAVGSYSPLAQLRPEQSAATAYLVSKAATEYFLHWQAPKHFGLSMYLDLQHYTVLMYGTFSLCFIASILPALFFGDIIERKAFKRRNYLAGLGISPMAYWTGVLLLHWLQCAAVYCAAFILGLAIDAKGFRSVHMYIAGSVTVVFGLINNLLIVYLLSTFFPSCRRILPAVYFLLSLIVGLSPGLVLSEDLVCMALIVALPPFASAVLTVYSVKLHVYADNAALDSVSAKVATLFGQGQVLVCIIAIPSQTAILVAALIMAENMRRICSCSSCTSNANGAESSGQDFLDAENSSALLPKTGSNHSENELGSVQLQHMSKSFANVSAVHDVTLSVGKRETLALIGTCGSGMTTVIGTIIGQLKPSKGKCLVRAANRWVSGRRVADLIAYAPQCNQLLFDVLTSEEHLLYYARMLGVTEDRVRQLLLDFNLDESKHRPTCQLSEGLKRRLSMAISLLSGSSLLVIDDASTGISPCGEVQQLWRKLGKASSGYSAAIISAHSLMGAEALGCRVALMVNGVVAFQGTVEQLKKRQGFHVLDIEIAADSPEAARLEKVTILSAITGRFFSSSVLDQMPKRMRISVPDQEVGTQFDSLRWLLQMKKHHGITSLQFYPASADQILEAVLKSHEAATAQQQQLKSGSVEQILSLPATSFYEHIEP